MRQHLWAGGIGGVISLLLDPAHPPVSSALTQLLSELYVAPLGGRYQMVGEVTTPTDCNRRTPPTGPHGQSRPGRMQSHSDERNAMTTVYRTFPWTQVRTMTRIDSLECEMEGAGR